MSEPTPIERKKAVEARAHVCRQEIQKLRDKRSHLKPPKIAAYREGYGQLSAEDVQLVGQEAMRAFLIQHLEAEALRYEREANRLRFEVIKWADNQREAMQAEIAAFNAAKLGRR